MIISEKQIHMLISMLSPLVQTDWTNITEEGRIQGRQLLAEIINQQSDELKDIGEGLYTIALEGKESE